MDSINYPLKTILNENYTSLPTDNHYRSYFRDLKQSVHILTDMVFRNVELSLIKFENQLSEMLVSFAMVDLSDVSDIKKWFEN
jgi:hypothetical protein